MAYLTGLPIPYADASYADTINLVLPWTTATTNQKDQSLQWGRVYIQQTYNVLFDQDNPSDAVKTANSMLANENLTTALFEAASAGKPAKGLTSTEVDAKGVKTKKSWDANISNNWIDPFPEITAILSLDGLCNIKRGGLQFVPLLRR